MSDFDPEFPCIYCELPVVELSVGGSAVCPWCDAGYNRDSTQWSYDTMKARFANGRRRFEESITGEQKNERYRQQGYLQDGNKGASLQAETEQGHQDTASVDAGCEGEGGVQDVTFQRRPR